MEENKNPVTIISNEIKQDNQIYKLDIQIIQKYIILNLVYKNKPFDEYELKLKFEELKNLDKFFSLYDTFDVFIELIKSLIENKKVSINKENADILTLELKVEFHHKEKIIKLNFVKKKINNNNLYLINQSLANKISELNKSYKQLELNYENTIEENNDLKTEIGLIKEKNERIKRENERIIRENEIIKRENERIKRENERIKRERIKEDNERINEKYLRKENKRIEEINANLTSEYKKMDNENGGNKKCSIIVIAIIIFITYLNSGDGSDKIEENNKIKINEENNKIKINEENFFSSNILKEDEFEIVKSNIESRMKKIIKSINIIYQSTGKGDDGDIFEEKVNNIQYTLLLFKSFNNKRFGGFASQSWCQRSFV